MTKSELIEALKNVPDDQVIVVSDREGGWSNIDRFVYMNGQPTLVYGNDQIFSDE